MFIQLPIIAETIAPPIDAKVPAPLKYLMALSAHMAPQIPEGAIISCRRITRRELAEIGSGVFVFEGDRFCITRRIKSISVKGGFKLCCDNQTLEDNVTLRLTDRWRVWQVLRIIDAPIS